MACRFKKYRIQTKLSKQSGEYYEWSLNRNQRPTWVTVNIATGVRGKPRAAGPARDILAGIERRAYTWYVP